MTAEKPGGNVGSFLDAVVIGCALGSILLLNESLIRAAGRRLVAQVDSWLTKTEPATPTGHAEVIKDHVKGEE